MIERLGQDAGGLEQHTEAAQARIKLDGEFGLDAKTLGAEAVPLLDTALGVAAVAAHVPLTGRAGDTGHRIGPPHDADDVVARREAVAGRGGDHFAVGFVAEHQPAAAGRCFTVFAADDLAVGVLHGDDPSGLRPVPCVGSRPWRASSG